MKQGYIYIDDNIYNSFFAISQKEQENGLMYINPPTPIMTFIYPYKSYNRFWMKNTPSKLDIIFSCDNKIIEICEGKPYSLKLIGKYQSDMVIELPYGYVEDNKIKVGSCSGILSY